MYIPKHFEIHDEAEIKSFIEANSFGQLVSIHDGAIVSTHMPFLIDMDNKKLIGHMAKANSQWQQIEKQKVLVSLQGPHAYVSPSWYAEPGVPTWNYQTVHIEGIAEAFTDTERLQEVVDTLTKVNESMFESPWQPDYAATMLRGIVGIELAVTSIQCKFKLSQNRSAQDQKNVSNEFSKTGQGNLVQAMARTRRKG